MLKTIAKSIGKTLISILIPFKLLAKGIYYALKAIVVPLYHLIESMIIGFLKGIKWLAIGFYKVLIYPVYLVLKKIAQWGYVLIKAIVLLIYNYLILPIYKVLKTIAMWFFEAIKWLSIGFYKVLIKPVYWVLKKLYKGLSVILSTLGHYLYQYALLPIFKVLKWLAKGFIKFLEKLIDGLVQIYKWLIQLGKWFLRFIKPLLKLIYNGIVYLLKGIRWLLNNLFQLLKWVYQGLEYLITKPIDFIIFLFKKFASGIRYLIDTFVKLYRLMPERLYLSLKATVIYVALLVHFVCWMIPKTILYTIPKWGLNKVYKIVKHSLYVLMDLMLKGLVLFINLVTKLTYVFNPLSRVIKDLVFDFKDYYYILLLLPILLPIFILFGVFVLVEVLFIHLWLMLKALFTKPNTFVKLPYLPSINLFKEADLYLRKVKLSLGYNQKWRNAHGLMVTIIWPLCFIIRYILALILLPITLLTGLFYGLRYGANRDYLSSNIADYLVIKTEYPGIIEAKPVKLFGHRVTIHVSNAYYDPELLVYVSSKESSQVYLSIELDGQTVHRQSIRIQRSFKTELLYAFLDLENKIQKEVSPRVTLPQLEGYTVCYQKTHQKDLLDDKELIIRDYANNTDLTVRVQQSKEFYERTFVVSKINTNRLEQLFFQERFPIYQNQNVLSLLDPKLRYRFLESPYLKGTRVLSKKRHFEVEFQVLGIDHTYSLPLQIIESPLTNLTSKNIVKKPRYDSITKRYLLQTQSVVNHFVIDIEWTLDGQTTETDVSLDSLDIKPYHTFIGTYKTDFNSISSTFRLKDDRYEAYTYEIERKRLEEALNAYSEFALTHVPLPTFQLKPIWACFFISKDPHIIKSTGHIQSNGAARFEVILYKHLFKSKKVSIQIKH